MRASVIIIRLVLLIIICIITYITRTTVSLKIFSPLLQQTPSRFECMLLTKNGWWLIMNIKFLFIIEGHALDDVLTQLLPVAIVKYLHLQSRIHPYLSIIIRSIYINICVYRYAYTKGVCFK